MTDVSQQPQAEKNKEVDQSISKLAKEADKKEENKQEHLIIAASSAPTANKKML